ncbi:site-specific integrase, partial [Acinetobacter schindleri]|uniref:site-specific integrase n=1 Tax=Acinetobacter schindleri TaxID=108981 RepID=UPI00321273D3
MNSEAKLDVLTHFTEHRFYILNSLNLTRDQNIECSQPEDAGSTTYMDLLMHKPVSKLSRFSDQIWDFNKDYPNAARNVQGAKLRIDFAKYKDIPKFVLIEIKIIFELALLNNLIFKPQHTGPRSRVKRIIKANSLIPYFKSGLTFINEIFKQAANELGYEFVQIKIRTLSDIGSELYYKAAANYERVKGSELDQFFGYLRSPTSLKYVFEKPITYVELNSLPWNKLANVVKEKKEQVLPDQIFETLSKVASFIVVDFLNAIGDRDRISDTHSLERFNTSNYTSWAYQAGINQEVLNGYIALRLKNKGYSSSFIKNLTSPYNWMIDSDSNIKYGSALRDVLINRGCTLVSLRDYFNLLTYSCMYLVGQYTGMRPSELAEVQVQNSSCLLEDNGIWLLESTVKKHQAEISTGLFDDKWVAIAIVRDAILAASYIAKIKASPYLVSNVDTVNPNSLPKPMSSKGITHQMNLF